jgi:hypothetical protein
MPAPDTSGLDGLSACHRDLLDLCDRLEEIADSLPRPDRQLCLHAARAIQPLIARAHDIEEAVLFPALETEAVPLADMGDTLERLRLEHCEDECFAEEVQDELMALGRGDDRLVLEATGYMLRGFFESLRRHVGQERMLLAALLARRAEQPVNRSAALQ